jgi:hypothetical protein
MGVMSASSAAPWPAENAPEPPRYADESAEEIEDVDATGLDPAEVEKGRPADRFLGRETSWLDFNARVLELAEDPAVPLLERVRFSAIFSRNLDEFFMVRVAALQRRVAAGITARNMAGFTPKERLDLVSGIAQELVARQTTLAAKTLLPELAEAGIRIVAWDDLDATEVATMRRLFTERIHPVLTPLAVDPAHPVPEINRLSLQPGRRRTRLDIDGGALRADQGATTAPPVRRHRRGGVAVHPARDGHRGEPRHRVPRHAGAGDDIVSRHPQ